MTPRGNPINFILPVNVCQIHIQKIHIDVQDGFTVCVVHLGRILAINKVPKN